MKKMGKVSSNKVIPAPASNSSSSANMKSAVTTPQKGSDKKAVVPKTAKVSPAPTTAPPKGKADAKAAPTGAAKKGVARAKPAEKEAPAAAPPPEPVVDPNKGISGEVTICYNHYKKKFPIVDASTTQTAVDEEYYLTFAFPNSKLHLSIYGPSDFSFEEKGMAERPLIDENPVGTYVGLVPDAVYWVHIEEDSAEKEAYEKRSDEYSKQQKAKREAEEEAEKNGLNQLVIEKREGCSCIEGNPCLDAYGCKDWTNRFEVAKKHGWKGFS